MKYKYSSVFALYILGLIEAKRVSGYGYETEEYYLYDFDRYCSIHTKKGVFSRDLIMGWAKARDSECPRTHRTRISPVRQLGKYMKSLGDLKAFILPSAMHQKHNRYVPHFFTNMELTAFFNACDNLKPHAGNNARHLVLPAFFRLLYCCGLRISEARTLRVENVDLQCGSINILWSKGQKSRRILISHDLLLLFRRYEKRVARIYPDRIYFFPTSRSDCYKSVSIGIIFRKIWKAAKLNPGCGNRPRAYDFRHHFALTNLNRWITNGVNVNSKLPYLTRYMGHSCIESTDYYLHLVPEFFQTFKEKVRITETFIPEVDYDGN